MGMAGGRGRGDGRRHGIDMIRVRVSGGLGNQLFQYACGRALAHRHNVPLAIHAAEFGPGALYAFQLHRYPIQATVLSDGDARALDRPFQSGWLEKALLRAKLRLWRGGWPRYYVEKADDVGANLRALRRAPSNCYLLGYWQSEEYFSDIEAVVRRELTLPPPMSKRDTELASRMREEASVCVVIRRGEDYTKLSSFFGLCEPTYFRRASELISQRVGTPRFYVFADDVAWAKEQLALGGPTVFVDHHAVAEPCEKLLLMSQCRHHIIANTTFGWWGAWLARAPSQIVVAPLRWRTGLDINQLRLRPADWMAIE